MYIINCAFDKRGLTLRKTKKILFNVSNINNWMGGVYYADNIINLMMHSEKLRNLYKIYVLVSPDNVQVFKKYEKNIELEIIDYGNCYFNSAYFVWYMYCHKIDYWYVLSLDFIDCLVAKKAIFWIADFQHLFLPEYFSSIELKMRNFSANYIARRKNVLVLSSEDAKKSFITHYKKYNCKCMVIHFTSNIDDEVKEITKNDEIKTLKKYNLYGKKYIYIPNQFWQHKNHIVVLKMIEKYILEGLIDMVFVFTGQMSDYRNKEYSTKLKKYFSKPDIAKVTKNLGFLERKEQLIIMKNAIFLIQPSLFEGWGTVLEDAKVLDKRVILSDLPVHEEQKYEKCSMFNRLDADSLLDKVKHLLDEKCEDDLSRGLKRFHKDSKKYAKELEKVLV